MATTLKRISVGNVGDIPGRILLSTDATGDEIKQAGFINNVSPYSGVQVTPNDFIIAICGDGVKGIYVPIFGAYNVITLDEIAGNDVAPGGITGGTNLGSGEVVYAGVSGSDLLFKTLIAGSNVNFDVTGTDITINAAASGGDGFQYSYARWVDVNGSDSNSGESIGSPMLTIQAAINSFEIPTAGNVIYISGGSYEEALIFPTNMVLTIFAPSSSLTNPGGPLFTTNGGYLSVTAYILGSGFVELLDANSLTKVDIKAQKIFANITGDLAVLTLKVQEWGGDLVGGASGVYEFESHAGDITLNDASGGNPKALIIGDSMTGDINLNNASAATLNISLVNGDLNYNSSSDCFVDIGVISGDVSILGSANLYGTIGKFTGGLSGDFNTRFFGTLGNSAFYTNGPILQQTSDGFGTVGRQVYQPLNIINSFTFNQGMTSQNIIFNSDTNITGTLPDYDTNPNIPDGYFVKLTQFQAGKVQILTQIDDILESVGSDSWTGGRGSQSEIRLMENATEDNDFVRTWSFGGQIDASG